MNAFLSIAAKIGSQKHLVAIRDAFIGIMPITMAGSIAVLLNVFLRDLPTTWGLDGFVTAMTPIISVNGNVWWGTIAMLALVFVFSLGYTLSNTYEVNPLSGGLVAIASFITVTPQVSGAGDWGNISWAYTNSGGLFTALIIGLLSTMVFVKLMKANLTIKLPDSVPPAVSKAFLAIIPGTLAIYVCAILAYLTSTFAGMSINDLVSTYIQMPFLALSQGYFAVLVATFAVGFFWFFGLHGTNILAPILDGTYLTALYANTEAYEAGTAAKDLPYIWTRGSFDAYAWMGGAGCTLALLIAILLIGKLKGQRAVAKISAPMGIFNINEPVMFGLPIVLNPVYAIPFIIIPPILVSIAYFATFIGLIPPVFLSIPWIMPPVIYAFLATGGSFMAAVVALINFVIATVIWGVFVMMANKQGE
ncbi:MAG: PTS transporter subunit EIIC [Lachnospiraceae bacterium]